MPKKNESIQKILASILCLKDIKINNNKIEEDLDVNNNNSEENFVFIIFK